MEEKRRTRPRIKGLDHASNRYARGRCPAVKARTRQVKGVE